MLKINLICIGKLKENYWQSACAEYEKRLRAFCHFSVIELPCCRLPENPSEAQILSALKTEGDRILLASKGSAMFALCVEGKQLTSEQVAHKINDLGINGTDTISFVVGSSYGLCPKVKNQADFCLSMSEMTFPHQLARVMLCEQIYRCFQIINHGKYHK